MGDVWGRITDRYEEYVRRYPEEGMVAMGGGDGSGLPLRESIKSGRGNIIESAEGELERECLISHDPELSPIESLSTEILEKLPIALTNSLQVQISEDHKRYWELTYRTVEDLNDSHDFIDRDLWQTIHPLFNLALVDSSKGIPQNPMELSEPSHETEIFRNCRYIAANASYPALEAYLKSRSGSVISDDGTVNQAQEIRRLEDGTYYDQNDTCSSLTDLLVYFEENVADPSLRDELIEIREQIAKFGDVGPDRAYGLIYRWRNTSLHGEGEADVQYGVILNMLSLLLWNKINQRM